MRKLTNGGVTLNDAQEERCPNETGGSEAAALKFPQLASRVGDACVSP